MSPNEFFMGKCILITGGSGFIGKVIIEKLLRSYGGIEKIYVLLRDSKGKSAKERLKIITDSQLFEKLKQKNPESLNKLIPICGDMSKLKLGLSENDILTIIEKVDIIYHGAASVRFDDALNNSVILNTRGTRELVNIALKSKKNITFLHISTAYCNSDKKYVEEKLYPAPADWRSTITLAEESTDNVLSTLTMKYIDPLPNTYTFSKSLAEHVVNDLCKGRLLAAIVRPTVVAPVHKEPIPGFVDNFNGPIGLLTAHGKGLMRVTYANEDTILNLLPVDFFVKLLISITYEKFLSRDINNIPIYNTGTCNTSSILNREMREMAEKLTWDAPYTKILWFPSNFITNNFYKFYLYFVLYHMIPALFFDAFLKLTGRKTMFMKIYRRVYVANLALIYFMQNSWTFANDKCLALAKNMREKKFEDVTFEENLLYDVPKEQRYVSLINAKITCSETLFQEEFNREKGFRNTMILWIVRSVLQFAIFGLLSWYFIVKLKIISVFINLGNQYSLYLSQL